MNYAENFCLGHLNSFNLPCCAEYFCSVGSTGQLYEAVEFAKKNNLAIVPLGGGTNIILPPILKGLVIRIDLKGSSITPYISDQPWRELTLCAGENWHESVLYSLSNKLFGMENLSLIPGTVGAAVIQNIGAYGTELSDFFVRLTAFDLDQELIVEISKNDCKLGYRDSIFKNEYKDKYIILDVTLKLNNLPKIDISYPDLSAYFSASSEMPSAEEVAAAVVEIRNNKLPSISEEPNVGSFFKNPIFSKKKFESLLDKGNILKTAPTIAINDSHIKIPAAWLIEKCGFKGKNFGGIGVHNIQPLVLVNNSEFRSPQGFSDLMSVVNNIRDRVHGDFAITLEIEPRIYGELGHA